MQSMFGALVAMEGDGKTMHFILQMCQDTKEFRVCLHPNDSCRETIEQFIGAMLVVLG